MTLIETYNKSLKLLKNPNEEEVALRLFLCDVNNLNSMSDFYLKKDENIKDLQRFNEYLQRFLSGEPAEYILGYCDFYGSRFTVNSDVLIPRPETEELVKYAIDQIEKNNFKRIVDVCCGSGCIGLSIAKNIVFEKILMSDISQGAVKIAKKNAKNLGINTEIICSDALSYLGEDVDIVVGNPPYIISEELIEKSVLNYEPKIALFTDNNITIYKKIISEAISHNAKMIILEIGEEILDLLKGYLNTTFNFVKYNVIKDINGKNRIISIKVA